MIFTPNVVECDMLETFSYLRMGPKAVAAVTMAITKARNDERKKKRRKKSTNFRCCRWALGWSAKQEHKQQGEGTCSMLNHNSSVVPPACL